MQQIADLLKEKELKVTPQRLAIYSILRNTKEHPCAETIYNKLLATHPTISLATVYKTLDALKKTGLIQELNVGEDSFRYDANAESHPHAICLKCKKVFDLDTDVLSNIVEEVQKATNFQIISEQIYFYGYCPNCKVNH